MEPEVRFTTAPDGVRLKYALLGAGEPLVWIPAWGLSSFEAIWELDSARPFFERLARNRTVIVTSRRGAGRSSEDVPVQTLIQQVSDIHEVVSDCRGSACDLFAMDDGASVAVAYTTSHPEGVRRLVLWAPYHRAGGSTNRKVKSSVDMIRTNWALARRVFADLNLPSESGEMRRWLAEYFRRSFSPETAVTYNLFAADANVGELLPRLSLPVLVLQRTGDRMLPFKVGEKTASMIPGARLVKLEGDTHPPFLGDQSFLTRVEEFLGIAPSAADAAGAATFRTMLFTDLVGHTEMMARLGDERGREVLREHERITREVLKAHGGTEVKTMGDGFMASFGSVTRAVECAVALQRAFEEWNASERAQQAAPLRVRVGLNAGEPIEEEGDLFGATVILASRIAAKAEGGEILVADTVRGLCSGKGFLFADRGEFVAKGFEEPVRVYEVRWRSG